MPKARTRSAPQWRTAPGLGTSATAVEEPPPAVAPAAPDPGPPREARPAPGARRFPPHANRRYRTPPEGSEPPAAETATEEALFTHTSPEPASDRVPKDDRPAGRTTEQPPRTTRDRPGAAAETRADEPAVQPVPELAAPQTPMNAELPRHPRTASPRTDAGSPQSRPHPSGIARYTGPEESFTRSVRSLEPISDLEATAFAGRFAADFQSHDEDQPTRRAEVLRPLLAVLTGHVGQS